VAIVNETDAALRFFGDDLDPKAITSLLLGDPTYCALKGDLRVSKANRSVFEKTGKWLRTAPREKPGNLQRQIEVLLADLTSDFTVWRDLSSRFRGDIYVGIFMLGGNEGCDLSAEALKLLADRGLRLGLEIYSPVDDDDDA